MKILPAVVKDKALWDFDLFRNAPAKLRQWLKDKAKLFTHGNFAPNARKGLNLLGEEEQPEPTEDELNALAEMEDGELCAVFRKRFGEPGARTGGSPARPSATAPPRRDTPPRDVGDVRCANCLEKGHSSRECTKPKKELKDRACFKCGKPGHQSRNCPTTPRPRRW